MFMFKTAWRCASPSPPTYLPFDLSTTYISVSIYLSIYLYLPIYLRQHGGVRGDLRVHHLQPGEGEEDGRGQDRHSRGRGRRRRTRYVCGQPRRHDHKGIFHIQAIHYVKGRRKKEKKMKNVLKRRNIYSEGLYHINICIT